MKTKIYLLTFLFALGTSCSKVTFGQAEEPPANGQEEGVRPEEIAPPPEPEASGRRAASSPRDIVQLGHDLVVSADEVTRDVVVVGANAFIDGTVKGSLVVVAGSAVINGIVEREMTVVLGSATVGPQGEVRREVVVVGGSLIEEPGAIIGGGRVVASLERILPPMDWLKEWFAAGVLRGRPFPPQLWWAWAAAGILLGAYLLAALLFPRPIETCVRELERQPAVSFVVGLFAVVALGPLLFILITFLVMSMVGVLLIPILVAALLAVAFIGKAAVYAYGGRQVAGLFHSESRNWPLLIFIGTVLFFLLYMVPFLGFIVWGTVTVFALGAVLMGMAVGFRQGAAPAQVPVQAQVPMAAAAGNFTGEQPPMAEQSAPEHSMQATAMEGIPQGMESALFTPAGFFRRLAATLLDLIPLAIFSMMVPIGGRYFLLLWVGYHIAMWAWKGTTIGGIVMSLKIVRLDGAPLNLGVAVVRCLSAFFSAFALFLGFIWVAWDKDRQSWHDKIAGTVIVKVPKSTPLI